MTLDRLSGSFGLGRIIKAGLIPVAALMLMGGCKKQQNTEAMELRDKLDSTEAALRDCESERARILAENDKLRGGSGGGATGFEDMGDVSRAGSDIVVAVAGDVLFDSGSVTIKSSAKANLDRIAGVLQSQYGGNDVRVAGHTDSDPIKRSKWGSNERLSCERALAVEEYLASRGVSKDRMYSAGYGPAKSKGDKKSSRRVEIVVIGGGGS